MWCYKDDKTKPVLTSEKEVQLKHEKSGILKLPKTAILLYMSGLDFIKEKYNVEVISDIFPRFLNNPPIYKIKNNNSICFLDGGRGAPMAADTIEVLNVLGVKNIISVGLMGGIVEELDIGDVVIPNKAYVEEGTSLHYYETIEYTNPDTKLFKQITDSIPNHKIASIVSCDAIYRQTYYKEKIWREKGCIGVDMETSALFSTGKYLDLRVVSILMVSDKHPIHEGQECWNWKMTNDLRKDFLYQVIEFAFIL